MDSKAQSFIMDLAVMTPLFYSSFWQKDESPPSPPSKSQCADEHARHNRVSQVIIKYVIMQHAWLEIGSFSAININYFVQ